MKGVAVTIHPDVEKFINSLDKPTFSKILRSLDLLENFGYRLEMPHSKKIKSNLFELRIKGKQEVRIFYRFYQGRAELIHAFIKKQQKIPIKEAKTALKKLEYI